MCGLGGIAGGRGGNVVGAAITEPRRHWQLKAHLKPLLIMKHNQLVNLIIIMPLSSTLLG